MDSTGHALRESQPTPEPSSRPMVETKEGSYPAPKGYRALSADDLALIHDVKEHGESLRELIARVEKHNNAGSEAKRWASIARTHLQQGYMALVRSVTRPDTFA